MWIVVLAWMYVASMMALAEATDPQGTVLGASITFLLYGVGPLALVMYLMGTPGRRRARQQAEARAQEQARVEGAQEGAPSPSTATDGGGLPAASAVPSVGKEAGPV